MRITKAVTDWDFEHDEQPEVLPFPIGYRGHFERRAPRQAADHGRPSTDDVLAAFATVSRRINDLARELKCLGYFNDEDDRPRAA